METATSTHKDVYQIINEKIIKALESGTVPWRKPWRDTAGGLPRNLVTKRQYRGINLLLLLLENNEQNLFLTAKQAKDIGAKVKEGERGRIVTYWKPLEKQDGDLDTAESLNSEKGKYILRYYIVYNISQCEGIPEKMIEPPVGIGSFTPIQVCDEIVAGMQNCPEIRFKEQKAYYDPLRDFINMPKKKSFATEPSYYSTLFHELVHSTGHFSRLKRSTLIEMSEFGSDQYSHEELVAEIGSCYLLNEAHITQEFEQNVAYMHEWTSRLKSDKRLLFSACTQAQRAVDYIIGVNEEVVEEQ